jgi:hypothetical protein
MRSLHGSVVPLLAALVLSGCTEVEPGASTGYEPAHLEEVDGSDLKQVRFTEEGARRVGLETATVRRAGSHRVVPYTALIYDAAGRSWVYAIARPLTYMRTEVDVSRIAGGRVHVTGGPPAGAEVVTIGATEVYGAELEIAGGH